MMTHLTKNLYTALELAQSEADKALGETDFNASIGHLQMVSIYCDIAKAAAERLMGVTALDAEEQS